MLNTLDKLDTSDSLDTLDTLDCNCRLVLRSVIFNFKDMKVLKDWLLFMILQLTQR
jgi:hypothetical protein